MKNFLIVSIIMFNIVLAGSQQNIQKPHPTQLVCCMLYELKKIHDVRTYNDMSELTTYLRETHTMLVTYTDQEQIDLYLESHPELPNDKKDPQRILHILKKRQAYLDRKIQHYEQFLPQKK